MKNLIPPIAGVFVIMALSNAVVPVLPAFGEGSVLQGIIFSAYFFGALITVFPAGYASDRIGPTPLIQTGLVITLLSGMILIFVGSPLLIILARFIEGIGAGLFIASAMSLLNARPDHTRLAGYFMAALNAGLLAGLAGTGWIVSILSDPRAGLFVFTILSGIVCILAVRMDEKVGKKAAPSNISFYLTEYRWLWYSAIIIVGTTGALTSLYPEFGGHNPLLTGVFIASMNLATMVSVLIVSRFRLEPIITIRIAAVGVGSAALLCLISPWGFPIMGAFAGFAIIAQMTFLAGTGAPQGIMMGILNTSTYGGLALLPFFAGFIAEFGTFTMAFLFPALLTITVAVTIGQCRCSLPPRPQ